MPKQSSCKKVCSPKNMADFGASYTCLFLYCRKEEEISIRAEFLFVDSFNSNIFVDIIKHKTIL